MPGTASKTFGDALGGRLTLKSLSAKGCTRTGPRISASPGGAVQPLVRGSPVAPSYSRRAHWEGLERETGLEPATTCLGAVGLSAEFDTYISRTPQARTSNM